MTKLKKATSKGGADIRITNGFIFNYDKSVNKTSIGRCTNRKCTSELTPQNDKIITHTQHNHESDYAKAESYLCHTKLKQLAKISTLGTSNIITSITKEYSNKEVINIPNRKTMINLTN
ncbi:hypothetical protein CDIK_2911, partial [Cucumispora dikerogammari]